MTLDIQGMTPLLRVFDVPTSLKSYCDVLGLEIVQTVTWRFLGAPDVDAVYAYLRAKGMDAKEPAVAPYGMKQLSLSERRLPRGVSRDVEELITALGDYIDQHNEHPKPFVWTAKASDILEKVKRARAALDNR